MEIIELAKKSVIKQPVYEPGKPIDDVARELGLDPTGIIKLASNENAFGPSPRGMAAARQALSQAHIYPDGGAFALREALARERGVSPSQLVIGNGSNEIIELLGHVFIGPGDEAVMGTPAFIVYKLVTLLFGATPVEAPLINHRHNLGDLAAAVTDRTRLVFLPSPNNPTGTANSEEEIFAFARSLPDHVVFVFDEAYAEYIETPPDLRPLIAEGRNIICLRTFSKIYGLASLRIGYGYCGESMAALLNRVRQPFNVNGVAQAAARGAIEDREFIDRCARGNKDGLRRLEAGLDRLGIPYAPSVGNFILAKVGDGAGVFASLQRHGIIVRPVGGYGLPDYVRITVGTEEENERLLKGLAHVRR